ncbi:Fe-S-containing protein, partial [Propionicimonas sp.]|uniref:Fe-S-containing protein n=1 Tax=Propionicimonas sp. TaxID=1955623 RepID=UPI0039E5EF4A
PLYQQFASAKLVPRNSLNFNTLLWIERNSVVILLVQTALAVLPAVVALARRTRAVAPDASAAERRLVRAATLSRRRFLVVSGGAAVLLGATYTVGKQLAEAVPELSPIEPSVVNGERVEVELSAVSDGHLHRFAHATANGVEVRFIVIQKNSVAFGTGLDACEICGPSGYYEREGKVVCRKCDVVMNVQTIGFSGGCNPIPLAYELDGGRICFAISELDQHEKVFD